jgi:hypothetical protein
MPVHALKSNFGKVARGVALALAMTGGAMAQEATAPAAPAQPGASGPQATEQQAGLPQGCLTTTRTAMSARRQASLSSTPKGCNPIPAMPPCPGSWPTRA